jgi:hypothetical protein
VAGPGEKAKKRGVGCKVKMVKKSGKKLRQAGYKR